VTTLDVVRASTFLAEVHGDVSKAPTVTVPVLGGHSGVTILPILSQAKPPLSELAPNITQAQIEELTKRIQFGGDEVVKAKDGTGSATLSMAYAGAEFASKILTGLKGGSTVVTQSYVDLSADPEGGKKVADIIGTPLEFFSVSVKLGVSRIPFLALLLIY
jgi:malate dehydrogenase